MGWRSGLHREARGILSSVAGGKEGVVTVAGSAGVVQV